MLIRKLSNPNSHQPKAGSVSLGWAVLAAVSIWGVSAQAAEPMSKEPEAPLNLVLPRGADVRTDVRSAARDGEPHRPRTDSKPGAEAGPKAQPFGAGYEARAARGLAIGPNGQAVPVGAPRASLPPGVHDRAPVAAGTTRPNGAGRGR